MATCSRTTPRSSLKSPHTTVSEPLPRYTSPPFKSPMFTHPAVGGVLSNTGSDADAKVPSTTESNTGRPWAVTMAPSSTPSGTMTLARSSRVGTAAGSNACAPAANCAPRVPEPTTHDMPVSWGSVPPLSLRGAVALKLSRRVGNPASQQGLHR